jgi:RNA polymerase sigma-70 factor (ECF subfamily)
LPGLNDLQESASPEHIVLRDEIEQTVYHVIANLPPELRMAITLRELEGFSYEQIAEMMHCPVGTVRSRIFRAREAIDKEVNPLMEH